MALAVGFVNTAATVAPVTTGGVGNNVDNTKSFQLLRDLANTGTITFRESLSKVIYTPPPTDTETPKLKLNPQSLDILNGIPRTSGQAASSANNQPTVQSAVPVVPAAPAPTATPESVFNLTSSQKDTLSSILSEFSTAPFDATTFQQIQSALIAAGINPQQISLQGILQQVFASGIPAEYSQEESDVQVDEREAA